MKNPLNVNLGPSARLFALLLAAIFFPCLAARANIAGPYAPDANTLYLFHFDEPAGSSVTTNVGLKGGNCITVTNATTGAGLATPPVNTNMLGQISFTGFGNCVSTTNVGNPTIITNLDGLIGYDGNNNGVYNADNNAGIPADAIAMTNLNIGNTNDPTHPKGNSPFTIEALVCPSEIGIGQQEIVCTDDSQGTGSRGFQFRINTSSQLEFNFIGGVGSGSKAFSIPTSVTDPNAFVPFNWYHVAVTYDGTNVLLYWTKLSTNSMACNQIGPVFPGWASTNSNGAVVAPLVIGDENRGGPQECFRGLIDEVRISNIARGPGQMMFTNAGVAIVQQPASQNIDYFQPATFGVTVSSPTPVGYQWRFNGTPINNTAATNVSYVIPSVDLNAVGGYDCVITNTAGYANTSSVALLVVGADHFLAHRWSFTGINDTTDSVAQANGVLVGAAVVTNGSLVLNGTTNTYMNLPSYLIFNTNTSAARFPAVTFEFWASYNTSGNNDRIFDFGNTNFVNATVRPPENYVFFSPHAGANHVLGFTPTTSESQISATGTGNLDGQSGMYVACVVDPPDNIMSIYTNGVFETSAVLSASLSSIIDQKCWIGRSLFNDFNGDANFNGSIDELRMYNGALSPASIAQSFAQGPNTPLNAGPVAIIVQPTNTTGAVGFPVSLFAALVGRAPINIQWYENGVAVPNATNSIYTFTPLLAQNGHVFQLLATNNVGGTNYNVVSSNATLSVTVPETLVWAGVNGNSWDTSTANWSNSTPALVNFVQYDGVVFDDRGGANQSSVNLQQAVNLTAMVVSNNAYNYVLQSTGQSGSLNGLGVSLVKAGTGTFTLDVSNNCSGSVLIQNGVLQIGNSDTFGALGGGLVTNNATLVFNRANSITVTNIISGTGAVTQSGSGDLNLSASNTFAGTMTVNNGRLLVGSPNATGNGNDVVNSGGQIYVVASSPASYVLPGAGMTLNGSGASGSGALRKGGSTTSSFGGTVTLGSDVTLNVDGGATLNLTNASGVNGSAANANLLLMGGGAGNITGPLNLGTGNLTVTGGVWTVSASNNYALTTINGGTLQISGPLSLGTPPGSYNASQVTMNGGALGAATSVTLADGTIGITVSSGLSAGFTTATNATFTISNAITADATTTITKTGSGTLILEGENDNWGGTFNIDGNSGNNDGSVVIANNAAIANILAVPGIPFIYIRNNNAGVSTFALDGTKGSITVMPDIFLSGRNSGVAAVNNLVGNNTISGGFTLQVGGSYPLQSDSGTLNFSTAWPEAVATNVTSGRTTIFMGAGTILMSAGIQDVVNSLTSANIPISIVKTGTGTLSLPTANSYSGTTVVSNGVLSLTGSLGTNVVTVDGGLLVGTGTINGPVVVQSAGSIEAGASNAIGTLNLANTLALGANTIAKINKGAGSAHDLFSGQSSVTYGGTLTVTNLSGVLTTNDTFTLFSPGASASNFSSIVGSPGTGLVYTFTNGVLGVAVGAKPVPRITHVSISGVTLTISGTNGAPGGPYVLLGSTNAALPLAQWTPILTNSFDGNGDVNLSTNIINTAVPDEFYILVQ